MARAPKDDAPSNAENKETVKGDSIARPLSPQAPEDRPSENTARDELPRAAFTNQPTPAGRMNLVDGLPDPAPVPSPEVEPVEPVRKSAAKPKVEKTGSETHVALQRGYAGTLVERGQFVPPDQPVGEWMVKKSEVGRKAARA